MNREADGRIVVDGAMTLRQAALLLAEGDALLSGNETVFDLSAVKDVDSSGLAVVFGWQRAAAAGGKAIRIVNPPANLLSLAALYGVDDLLPLA